MASIIAACTAAVGKDITAAMLLAHFASPHPQHERDKHGKTWIVQTGAKWQAEAGLSARQYDRALRVLKDRDLVHVHAWQFCGTPTTWLRLSAKGREALAQADLPPEVVGLPPGGGNPLSISIQQEASLEKNKKEKKGCETATPSQPLLPLNFQKAGKEENQEAEGPDQCEALPANPKEDQAPAAALAGASLPSAAQPGPIWLKTGAAATAELAAIAARELEYRLAAVKLARAEGKRVRWPAQLVWADALARARGNAFTALTEPPDLTPRQIGQISTFLRRIALAIDDPVDVLRVVVADWSSFVLWAEADEGAFDSPVQPDPKYLLRYLKTAGNLWLASLSGAKKAALLKDAEPPAKPKPEADPAQLPAESDKPLGAVPEPPEKSYEEMTDAEPLVWNGKLLAEMYDEPAAEPEPERPLRSCWRRMARPRRPCPSLPQSPSRKPWKSWWPAVRSAGTCPSLPRSPSFLNPSRR